MKVLTTFLLNKISEMEKRLALLLSSHQIPVL